jgi:uncharacterized protein with PIN domain
MKIIKRVEPVAELPKEVICKVCVSVIQLETTADIKAIPDTATTKQGKGWTCPVCLRVNCINIG